MLSLFCVVNRECVITIFSFPFLVEHTWKKLLNVLLCLIWMLSEPSAAKSQTWQWRMSLCLSPPSSSTVDSLLNWLLHSQSCWLPISESLSVPHTARYDWGAPPAGLSTPLQASPGDGALTLPSTVLQILQTTHIQISLAIRWFAWILPCFYEHVHLIFLVAFVKIKCIFRGNKVQMLVTEADNSSLLQTGFYSLILAIISISYDKIVQAKVTAEIWECGNIATTNLDWVRTAVIHC